MRQMTIGSGPDIDQLLKALLGPSGSRQPVRFQVSYTSQSGALPIGFVEVTIDSLARADETGDYWIFSGQMTGLEGILSVKGMYNTHTCTGLLDQK